MLLRCYDNKVAVVTTSALDAVILVATDAIAASYELQLCCSTYCSSSIAAVVGAASATDVAATATTTPGNTALWVVSAAMESTAMRAVGVAALLWQHKIQPLLYQTAWAAKRPWRHSR